MKKLRDYVDQGLFYKSVVEDGSDIIFIVDYKGDILYHNASVEETLGHKPKSLIDKNFFDYILPETLLAFKTKYQLSCKMPYQEAVEFQFLCKDGSYKYLEFNSINLIQKEEIEGLILDCRDITQRKKDGEELLRAQKAKEQFLANISHEIRTPINGIAGMATLLSKSPTAEEQRIYLNAIRSAADNLKVIINDILDLASTGSGKLKFEKIGFNLKDLLTSLVGTFSVQAREKGIALSSEMNTPPDLILIGDPVRLNQILINLISNAIKFTHVGHILIRTLIEKSDESKILLRFEVEDTGIGVPSEKLSTIFESFGQADASVTRKYGGTGLGLTIVKQLVELQSGAISVSSKEDKGSTFTVIIPYTLGKQGDVTETSAQSGSNGFNKRSLKNLNVLLVEDNDINRLYAKSLLKTLNCQVETAENGYVALEKLKSATFDVVLMDIQMPVMDGFEATKAIRLGDPPKSEIPIIALTANATPKDFEKCLSAGMNDCVAKPFTPEDLFAVLIKYSLNEKPVAMDKTVATRVDLSYLKKVANGNADFIKEMITTFQDSVPSSLLEIRNLCSDKQWSAVAKALHKIKPTLTMMGLTSLREEVIVLEEHLKTSPAESVIQRVIKFTEELNLAVNELGSIVV